jgi:hypothetical protein
VRKDTIKRNAFDSNIVTLRSTYQFTRFTFFRTRVDYDSIQSNFSGQLLFGWNPSPGTAFYAGYNDNFNYNGFNPVYRQFEPRFERNSRTFFIRASYLFPKEFLTKNGNGKWKVKASKGHFSFFTFASYFTLKFISASAPTLSKSTRN